MIKEQFKELKPLLLRTTAAVTLGVLSFMADSPRTTKPEEHHQESISQPLIANQDQQGYKLVFDSPNPNPAQEEKPCIESGFNPDTILNDGIDGTVLEVNVKEDCRAGLTEIDTSLLSPFFTVSGQSPRDTYTKMLPVILKDTGKGEDKKAGDGIFTSEKIRYDSSPVPSRYNIHELPLHEGTPGLYLGEPFENQLKFTFDDGSTKAGFGTPKLLVLDKNIPIIQPTKRSELIQTTPRITNIKDANSVIPQFLGGSFDYEGVKALTNTLYSTSQKPDPYHVLLLTADRDFFFINSHDTSPFYPSWYYAGLALSVRRDFTGTGTGNTIQGPELANPYGSQGNLRHITIIRQPVPFYIFAHELTHWVAAYLPEELGLNGNPGHWKTSNSAEGILFGGLRWKDNGDGTFTMQDRPLNKLSKLEQYLMGWIPPEQIPKIDILLNTQQEFYRPGAIIRGPFKEVTKENIIDAVGIRTPGPKAALRNFQVGYIMATKDRFATPAEMRARELLVDRFRSLWPPATDFQSQIEFVTAFNEDLDILEPSPLSTIPDLSPSLTYIAPQNITSLQLQLIPINNDGPGVNLLISDVDGNFKIPAPVLGKGPYVMLPDMTYTWRIRTTSQPEPPNLNQDQGWSQWIERKFRTPAVSSETIHLGALSDNQETSELTPTLTWTNENQQVFYYEVQLSEDPEFETDPQKAHSPLYWNLVHAGTTNPPNSWTLPRELPLKAGTHYFWRMRPHIQGDGTAVPWTKAGSFHTS